MTHQRLKYETFLQFKREIIQLRILGYIHIGLVSEPNFQNRPFVFAFFSRLSLPFRQKNSNFVKNYQPMRVLIVNTSERTGGAALAAHRLMDALNNCGVKAKMLVRDK